MKKPHSNKKGWIYLTVLLLLFMGISYFLSAQKPKDYPAFVSDSPAPAGVKAFYTYLKKETGVKSWNLPPDRLPKNLGGNMLVMVEPAIIPDTNEMEAYIEFMEAGNSILLLQDNPKGMFDMETLQIEDSISYNIYDKDNKAVKSVVNSQYRVQTNKQDQILLHDNIGTISLTRSFGKGQLLVAVTPEWVTNKEILKQDHLTQVLHLLKEGTAKSILFDEYIHGNRSVSEKLLVYPKWFLLLLLQGILLTMIWLWVKGKRFGPLIVPREESVRFSDEGIQALTAWYLRGRRYHDSLLIQADYLKLLIQERWGIPYSKEWKDVAGLLERKWQGIPASEIQPFLNGLVNMIEREKINKQEYLLWSRKLDQLRKVVAEE